MPQVTVTIRLDDSFLVSIIRKVAEKAHVQSELLPAATAVKAALEDYLTIENSSSPNQPSPTPHKYEEVFSRETEPAGRPMEHPYPSVPTSGPVSQPLSPQDVESRLAPIFKEVIERVSSERFDGLELCEDTPDELPSGEFKRSLPWANQELIDWSKVKDPVVFDASDAEDIPLVLAYRILYSGIPTELQGSDKALALLKNLLPAFRQAATECPDKLPPREVILYQKPED